MKYIKIGVEGTENERVQAFIGHVLVDEHLFFPLDAATQEPD